MPSPSDSLKPRTTSQTLAKVWRTKPVMIIPQTAPWLAATFLIVAAKPVALDCATAAFTIETTEKVKNPRNTSMIKRNHQGIPVLVVRRWSSASLRMLTTASSSVALPSEPPCMRAAATPSIFWPVCRCVPQWVQRTALGLRGFEQMGHTGPAWPCIPSSANRS